MIQFTKEFNYIKIKLASSDRILKWATRKLPNGQFIGEVLRSETINYRTFKPEMGGLFCERIFGPSKSLECACGKYKRIQYEGLICERCGVELTESRVRRHRMGHINLIYPITHVWYITSQPNYLSLLLEIETLEKQFQTGYVIKRSDNCKTCSFLKPLKSGTVKLWDDRIKRIKLTSLIYFIAEDDISFYGLQWDFQQYRQSRELGWSCYPIKNFPESTKSRYKIPQELLYAIPNFLIGTPLLKLELERLNLKEEICRTRCFVFACTKILKKEKVFYGVAKWTRKWEYQRIYKMREQGLKRIRIMENLIATGARPDWIILSILPIIPPALRPLIQLEGGRFATSDLNELYRRIITRNNRLLRLLEIDAPKLILRNEKRLLQEAIDTLIDNGKRGKVALSANNRPLKSLSDIIKGKHGRFRQNLLGKRVDYSGRSVIVVGPSLELNQCGLPYEMAIELFQPFVIRQLINLGLANNMKIAKNLIKHDKLIIEPVLNQILLNHPIFLNRAPTLHRLGIQAFQPILVKGRAIKLHPLVCSAFNADFDGDQMAVHIPLSIEAQSECYMLMLAPYNFLSPANGQPIVIPSQDMVLGCYYLTTNNIPKLLGANHYFADFEDVILAYNQENLDIHSSIWVRYYNSDQKIATPIKINILNDNSIIEHYSNLQKRKNINGETIVQYLKTTTGRIIFNYIIQKTLNFL